MWACPRGRIQETTSTSVRVFLRVPFFFVVANSRRIAIYHVNDIHAHLDEISSSGTDCTRPERGCYGGYARIKSVVDQGRAEANNSLFLNMGDEFQGTLFYQFYGGEKIAETLNQLHFDALTLGNHEFDQGDEYLGTFVSNFLYHRDEMVVLTSYLLFS